VESAKQTVANGAQSAGGAISGAARKAKGPALAGGAALLGLAGGIAVARRNGPRKVLGVPVPGTSKPLVKVKVPRRSVKLGAAKLPMPKSVGEVRSLAKQVGKASKQAGETGQDVGKKIQRFSERAERVGNNLS
jgi:hypothetical protein